MGIRLRPRAAHCRPFVSRYDKLYFTTNGSNMKTRYNENNLTKKEERKRHTHTNKWHVFVYIGNYDRTTIYLHIDAS